MRWTDWWVTGSPSQKIGVAWASMSNNTCSFLLLEQIGWLEHLQNHFSHVWTLARAQSPRLKSFEITNSIEFPILSIHCNRQQDLAGARPGVDVLPIGTNCIKLLELMSINSTMATTCPFDMHKISESQRKSHICSYQTCSFLFVFGMRGTELRGVVGSLVMSCPPVHPSHSASKNVLVIRKYLT